MGLNRCWTAREEEYLCDAWGKKPLSVICRHLNRSENAVKIRVSKMGIGAARENNCDYITLNSLANALYGCLDTTGKSYTKYQILPKILKIHMIPQPKVKRRCVKLSEFWEAAKANRYLFDFSKLERFALGPEPAWVEKQRRIDGATKTLRRSDYEPWNAHEESLLRSIASKKKYTCNELARMFKRSEGSVMRKLFELGLHKCLKKNMQKHYTQEELDLIAELIIQGCSYPLIAQHTGRSEKSLRGVIFHRFGTESLGKINARLQSGERLEELPRYTQKKRDIK